MAQILTVTGQPFTWDGDTAVIENQEGEAERYEPLPDGTYDTGYLGFTFSRVPMCRQEGCAQPLGNDSYDDRCAHHADWVFEHRRGVHATNPVADCPTCLDPDPASKPREIVGCSGR